MIVQIYEIQTPQEADVMVESGVDHVGSVLISDAQWRNSELHDAIERVRSSGRKSSLIPLFDQADTISRAIDYYRPHILHFCEALPPKPDEANAINTILALQQTIKNRFPEVEIMRSIPIAETGKGAMVPSLEYAAVFEPWSDWFLTDTLLIDGDLSDLKDQPVNGFVGITGKTCDWDVARKLVEQSRIPVILAGGIGPDNVASGISSVGPEGIDSCTLTNAVGADGRVRRFKKDPDKVREIIDNARKAAIAI